MTTLTTDAVDTDRAAFFAAMGWDGGRVEVVAGTNQSDNPDKIDLITFDRATKRRSTRRWIAPDDVTELEKAITRLSEQWGNVYVSVGTYDEVPNRHRPGTMTYNRSAPRPRRCFILDDVTDILALRLPPTWANETSPGNYQVGYTCTDLLIPKQAEMLGKGAMLLARADNSGWDATQIIRLPGTLNTKPKCVGRAGDPKAGIEPEGWTVRLLFADGPRYTPQQLAMAFLPGGVTELGAAKHSCSGKSERSTVPVDREMLARLPDGASLMNTPRFRARFCRRPQLAQLAAGETVILPTKYGLRSSGSEQVAVLVVNLLTDGRRNPDGIFVPGLGAPPLDEIRAVALFWRERLRPGYDIGRYIEDVERLINAYTPVGYAPEPTYITEDSIPSRRALIPSRKPGRPYGPRDVAADALLSHCATLPIESDGWTRTTTKALAKHLNLSLVHIGRLLSDVRRTGQLESRTEPRALALRLIPKEGAFNDEGYHLFKGAFNDEGHHSPSLDRIETRNDGDGVQGEYTPPAPVPALPACSGVADVALLPAQPASVDATLYVDHGTLVGEPDAMDETAWLSLMTQRVPIGELLDPGAIAAWVVDGLCEVPAAELPPSDCANDAIVAWVMDGLCEVPAAELPPSDCADDDEAIIADEARILAYPTQDAPRRPLYKVGSAMLTSQDGSGATEQVFTRL